MSKLPPIDTLRQMRDLADVPDDAIEGALATPQRTHAVVRIAVAIERDLDAVQAAGVEPLDHLRASAAGRW